MPSRVVSTLCVVVLPILNLFVFAPAARAADGAPIVVKDYGDALKQLAVPLAEKAKTGDLQIVWCFAQSPSLLDDRVQLAKELSAFYQTLADAAKQRGGGPDAVLSSVASYDRTFVLHTGRPVNTVSQVALAVTAIPAGTASRKQQCPAVGQAVRTLGPAAKAANRSLVLVLVTDESGDVGSNTRDLEKVIVDSKAAACPVYVFGREAVFGVSRMNLRHVDNFGQTVWLPIDRGPETAEPELLPVSGLHRRDRSAPSGFGPFEQMRMARETGGTFYLIPSPEARQPMAYDAVRARAEAMREMQPDLSSRAEYAAARDQSPLRKAIGRIAAELNPEKNPRAEVRIENFPLTLPNPTAFRAAANQEVAKAKALAKTFETAEQSLLALKEARAAEPSLRWQANYDLMVAQLAAARIRCEAYAVHLQNASRNPPVVRHVFGLVRPTTEWDVSFAKLPPVDRAEHQPDLDNCVALLNAIREKYKGTPYAMLAEAELQRDFGLTLVEGRTEPRR